VVPLVAADAGCPTVQAGSGAPERAGSVEAADGVDGRHGMAALEVVAAVLIRDGRALACRRAAHKAGAGTWEFPGGKVERGESPEAALAREIREELGVDVTVGPLVDRSEVPVGDRVIDLACYRADPVGPLPTSSTDHDELRWVPLADLGDLSWSAPDLPAVRRLVLAAVRPLLG
jgi:8-oxo-dGTP diphosphatase